MERLILVTSYNSAYLHFVIQQWIHYPESLLIVTDGNAHQFLKQAGTTPQLIMADERINMQYDMRSKWFADKFMSKDSVLGNSKITRNGLTIREALSIDRLRFFASDRTDMLTLIDIIDWSHATVEFDIFSSLPFSIAKQADVSHEVEIFVDDAAYWHSWPEIEDIKKYIEGGNIHLRYSSVMYPEAKEYCLTKSLLESTDTIPVDEEIRKELIENVDKAEGVDISNSRLYGVIFDKRYENRIMKTIAEISRKDSSAIFIFFCIDSRSEQVLSKLAQNFIAVQDINVLLGTHEVIAINDYEDSFSIRG